MIKTQMLEGKEQTLLRSLPEVNLKPILKSKRFFAVCNKADEILGVVTNKYQLIQHRDVFKFTKMLLPDFELHKVGLANNGQNVAMFWKGGREISINGDKHCEYVQTINSITGKRPLGVRLGFFRFVCTNGQMIGNTILNISQRHVRGEIDFKKVEEQVLTARDRHNSSFISWAENLAKISGKPLLTRIKTEFGKVNAQSRRLPIAVRLAKPLSRLPDNSTLWDIYNSFTNVLSHQTKSVTMYDRLVYDATQLLQQESGVFLN